MQAQRRVPNPGLGSPMAQPNGRMGGPSWHETWQTDTDDALRQTVVDNILQLFQNIRAPVFALRPDFVKRMEEELYRSAATKEEYADQATLERRLLTVGEGMRSASQRATQLGSQIISSSLGNMMPTPANGVRNGMQVIGNNQHLMNDNASMHNQINYLNNQFSRLQL